MGYPKFNFAGVRISASSSITTVRFCYE